MIRDLFESELTKEIKKSEQAAKVKDQDRKDGDEDKTDKDIRAAEIEKQDTEPNTPKKEIPSQAEIMAQNPDMVDGEAPEEDNGDAPEEDTPKKDTPKKDDRSDGEDGKDEEKDKKKKKNESFLRMMDNITK